MIPEVLSFGKTGFGDELLLGTYRTLLIAVCAYALGLILRADWRFGKVVWGAGCALRRPGIHDSGAGHP